MKNIMLNKRKTNQHTLVIMVLVLLTSFNSTAVANNQPSLFDVMNHTEVLDLTIETNLTALKENRRSAVEYPATIHFKDQFGNASNWLAKVTLRGNFRRMKCTTIPPLKLNFKKKALTAAGLAKFDDYKLVSHCIDDPKQGKELVLKEYLAYKLFNGITDNSFRVQLLNITFIDPETGEKIKQSGFIIEDTAQLRSRLRGEKVEQKINVPYSAFNAAQVREVALFQYAIGNSDWDLVVSRNVKYIQKDGQIFAIPYDFDFSGLVGAPYAIIANPKLGIVSIKERVYLGFDESNEMLNLSMETFKEHQSTLLQIVRDFKQLKGKARRDILTYLNTFFDSDQPLKMPNNKLLAEKIEH